MMLMMIAIRRRLWSVIALVAVVVVVAPCRAAPVDDRVAALPLYGPPPTPHYSGYLDATAGCHTAVNGAYCQLHYWFATADGPDAATKPVVLWLNGGPGASSVVGMLQENGPLLIDATGGLMVNPYSWTAVANLLVIESPVGVGYSYCEAQARGRVCVNTDTSTASAARAALVDFFQTKFPELFGNDLYLTGESYAGVYLPTLAYEILRHNAAQLPDHRLHLVGLAVGDPCTDSDAQRESMDGLWYSHRYGLVDDAVYDVLRRACHVRAPNALTRSDDDPFTPHPGQPRHNQERTTTATAPTPECTLAYRKFLLSSSRGIAGHGDDRYVDRYSLYAPVTDAADRALEAYMNRRDVRDALHVRDAPVERWTLHAPPGRWAYTKEYRACNRAADDETAVPSLLDVYRKIVPHLRATWLYNGDTDPAVSYEGTRTAVKRMGYAELDGGGYRPWFYNHTATTIEVLRQKAVLFGPDLLLQDTGAQFGGEVVNYEHGLSFLTVHGSGHMVPQFRPQAALHILHKLLGAGGDHHDLSPLLPTNATLTNMSDAEFARAMDAWTERAKTAPYILD